ncbi:MAG: hypothetical protein O7I93_02180 [Gemmatimonadetes bacterium]|nr:hypothetical protein [Gemmatimonadota bacterium]
MATIRVFINEVPLAVPAGSTVRQAVAIHHAVLLDSLDDGRAYVTDGRGITLELDASLQGGSILRVVVSRRRGSRESHADA